MESRWLKLEKSVKTTPAILRVIKYLDPFFEGHPAIITSGLRTVDHQLAIIMEKIAKHGIGKDFPEYTMEIGSVPDKKIKIGEKELYWWQRPWSKLLQLSDIVNPPLPAEVLFDYFRPGDPANRKGRVIGLSPHQTGLAFDIGGGADMPHKANCVAAAIAKEKGYIKGYLVENENNAIHVDCVAI